MFLSPRIVIWKQPGKKCSTPNCEESAFYRASVPRAQRKDQHGPTERQYFYCPSCALRWAAKHNLELPKVK